jgi:hypothetical protein
MEKETPTGFTMVPSRVHHFFGVLAATMPGLAATWEQHLLTEYPGASVAELSDFFTGFSYQDTDVFISCIADHLARQDTAYFPAFFQQVDFMLVCGDSRTEELTAMGLLEGMQNRLAAAGFDHYTALNKWLQPATKQFWDDLNNFWDGK